jgi:hypothetical protein
LSGSNLCFPASSACASETLWRGIWQFLRSALLPVSVPLRFLASLPDKFKLSSKAESGNGIFATYPQAAGFAVDKMENNHRCFQRLKQTDSNGQHSHKRIRPPRGA